MARLGLAGVAFAAIAIGREPDASACGACFASSSESTIVNDHKMALLVSSKRTILWDQISYSGNPTNFAYVVPVKPGTRVEPSTDEWFAALDAATRPILMSPTYGGGGGFGPGGGGGDYNGGYYGGGEGDDTGGCGCGSKALSSAYGDSASAGADGGASPGTNGGNSGAQDHEPVEVVTHTVVGPYEQVTLHANDKTALPKWLTDNGYAIPDDAGPIVDDYVTAGFDFIALKLRPDGAEIRSIQPIRIVSPGGDASLPFRMMKIGSGANLGITLYVIGEGRYHPSNFPDVQIDFTQLLWDFSQQRSNYQYLAKQAMASGDGRGFLTEYANKPSFEYTGAIINPSMTSNPGIADAYLSVCKTTGPYPEAGFPEDDAGSSDAASDVTVADAAPPDDAGDGGPIDDGGVDDAGPPPEPPPWTPAHCDDVDVAQYDLHAGDIWITRLRANLPRPALDATLLLEPTTTQTPVDNVHYAQSQGTLPPGARIAPRNPPRSQYGTIALALGTAFALSRLVRRRRGERD
jgi:hypothetical protein